jgi:type I site-specific restriction-modification system R (restriction) subunit
VTKLAVAILASLALIAGGAGCGGSDESSADEAIAQIDAIGPLLDDAVEKYRNGNRQEADRIVGDAYLEHFEDVEDPLEERDEELMEKLEHAISTEIRERMKQGAPPEEVGRLVTQTKQDLSRARALLSEES